MKAIVICFSYHHKNTEKVASVLANTLGAELKTPSEVKPNELSEYDLIGFGSGISFGKHYNALLEFADKLPQTTNKKAFIFSTSGQTGKSEKFHKLLREKLHSKGFVIAGEFNCAGFDTYGFLKIGGGIKKGHPNEDDLKQAESFAQSLKQPEKT
jgi:flavodoxin